MLVFFNFSCREHFSIYRERREYDCSCCRHFIRDVGNVVSIKNGELHTIWGINPVSDDKYNVVAAALDAYVKQKAVLGVFLCYGYESCQ